MTATLVCGCYPGIDPVKCPARVDVTRLPDRDRRYAHGGPPAPRRTWRIQLPWTRPPHSMNDREHWRKKARRVKASRETAAWLLRSAHIPPLGHVRIELHYAPRDARRRDEDNYVATLKVCADALQDAGIVPDDTPTWVTKVMPVIHPPTGTGAGACWLVITESETP